MPGLTTFPHQRGVNVIKSKEENCSSSAAIINVSEHCHCFACAVRCRFASVLGNARQRNGATHVAVQCMAHSTAVQRAERPLDAGGSFAQQVQVGSPVMYASTFLLGWQLVAIYTCCPAVLAMHDKK